MKNFRIITFLLAILLFGVAMCMSSCDRKSGHGKTITKTETVKKSDTINIVFDSIKSVISSTNSLNCYIIYNNGEYRNRLLDVDYQLASKINLAMQVKARLKLYAVVKDGIVNIKE